MGGPGFEYTLTLSYFTPQWQPIALPYEARVTLDDVGSTLRYAVNAETESVLMCEAIEPTERLNVGCRLGVSGLGASGITRLPVGEDIPVVVRDVSHRGVADLPIDLAISAVPLPETLTAIDQDEVSGAVEPGVMITGPAVNGLEPPEIRIAVSEGQVVIALVQVVGNYAWARVEFADDPSIGRPLKDAADVLTAFRATADGEVLLSVQAGCSSADVPCSGTESYELQLFSD
jgi:hypothetical protein